MKILFLTICFLFIFIIPVSAAEIFFGVQNQTIGLGKLFEVGVFIDTEDEPINTMAGKIKFSSEFLELKEIRRGGSAVNFWVERPATKEGEVVFSGITPGGYVGQSGYLFSLIFETKKAGETVVAAAEEQMFLNDGKGSKTIVKQAPLSLQIEEGASTGEFSLPRDSQPPEPFELTIAQDPKIFGGKYFLVFATQDKDSGTDRYEAQESISKEPKAGKWVKAESPYVLKDQRLKSYIFVKAVDGAGNERISKLEPPHPLLWYEKYLIWGTIILLIIFGIGKFLWRKLRR